MANINFPSFKIDHGRTFGSYVDKSKKGDWSVFYTSGLPHANLFIGSHDASGTKVNGMHVPVTCNDDAERILGVIKKAHEEDWDGLRLWHELFDKKGE